MKGWCKGWRFGCVADRQESRERLKTERGDEADEEDREERKPGLLVRGAAVVGHQERDYRDGDGRDRDPEPGAPLVVQLHS